MARKVHGPGISGSAGRAQETHYCKCIRPENIISTLEQTIERIILETQSGLESLTNGQIVVADKQFELRRRN